MAEELVTSYLFILMGYVAFFIGILDMTID